jgi:hypothetical protein
MRIRARSYALCLSAGLALALNGGFVYGQTNAAISGSYGFLIGQSFSNTDGEKALAFVGVMNLDGAGGATATATIQNGAGPRHLAETDTLPLAGTYSTKPDGTGTLKLGAEGSLTLTFAMVISDGGQYLQLLATGCSVGPDDCGGPYTSVSAGIARATNGGAASLNGSYGFQLNSSPVPSTSVGVLKFDGAGNATISYTQVGTSNDFSLKAAPSASATMSGTYTMNPDGTGSIALKSTSDPSAVQGLAFVATDGGSGLLLIRTEANTPNSNTSFGSARLQ